MNQFLVPHVKILYVSLNEILAKIGFHSKYKNEYTHLNEPCLKLKFPVCKKKFLVRTYSLLNMEFIIYELCLAAETF